MKKIEGRFFISIFSQLSSGDASDSICPKGWGMAGYSRDGSYQKFIVNIYGMNKTHTTLTNDAGYKEYNRIIRADEFMILSSLSFARIGYNVYETGKEYRRMSYGFFWESRAISDIHAYGSSFGSTYIRYQNTSCKGSGFSLRFVAK